MYVTSQYTWLTRCLIMTIRNFKGKNLIFCFADVTPVTSPLSKWERQCAKLKKTNAAQEALWCWQSCYYVPAEDACRLDYCTLKAAIIVFTFLMKCSALYWEGRKHTVLCLQKWLQDWIQEGGLDWVPAPAAKPKCSQTWSLPLLFYLTWWLAGNPLLCKGEFEPLVPHLL